MEIIIAIILAVIGILYRRDIKHHQENLKQQESKYEDLNRKFDDIMSQMSEQKDSYFKSDITMQSRIKELEFINTQLKESEAQKEQERKVNIVNRARELAAGKIQNAVNKIHELEMKLQEKDLERESEITEMKASFRIKEEHWQNETNRRLHAQKLESDRIKAIEINDAKESSRRQSKAANFGNDMQHYLPFIIAQDEGMNHKDLQWLGGTMDAIMYDGLNDDEEGDITIRMIDFKCSKNMKKIFDNPHKVNTYDSYDPFKQHLGPRQKKVLEALQAGRITFEIWAMDPESKRTKRFIQTRKNLHLAAK